MTVHLAIQFWSKAYRQKKVATDAAATVDEELGWLYLEHLET